LEIIFLETGGHGVAQACLCIDELAPVQAHTIEEPVVLGWGHERFEAVPIGAQEMGQRQRFEAVVFGR
jgi:hypothetical protein